MGREQKPGPRGQSAVGLKPGAIVASGAGVGLGAAEEGKEGEEEGEEVAWHGGTPGARLGAGRNGRSGRALKEKGTGTLTPGPSRPGHG